MYHDDELSGWLKIAIASRISDIHTQKLQLTFLFINIEAGTFLVYRIQ